MKKYIVLLLFTIFSFQCFGQCYKRHKDPIQGQYTAEQCPKCGSIHIKIAEKNFNGWAALGGAVLFGPLGLAAGAINMGDAKFICTKCGFDFDHEDITIWNRTLKQGEIPDGRGRFYSPQQLKEIRKNQKQ